MSAHGMPGFDPLVVRGGMSHLQQKATYTRSVAGRWIASAVARERSALQGASDKLEGNREEGLEAVATVTQDKRRYHLLLRTQTQASEQVKKMRF